MRDVALVGRQRGDVLAADQDAARGRLLEPRDHAQRRRLAAAGRAEQRDQRARLDRRATGRVDRGRPRRSALRTFSKTTEPRTDVDVMRSSPVEGRAARPARTRFSRRSRRSPDEKLEAADDDDHHHDQHRGIGDGDAVFAVLDQSDDVGGGHVVLGADQEDDGADRGDRAHEASRRAPRRSPAAAAAG